METVDTSTPQPYARQKSVVALLKENAGTPESQKKVTPSRLQCIGKLEEELTCAICLGISVRPCTTPCGHSFCRRCLRQLLQHGQGQKCPGCRTQLPAGMPLVINTVMWNTIQMLFPRHAASATESPAVMQMRQAMQAPRRGQPLSRFNGQQAAVPRTSAAQHIAQAVGQSIAAYSASLPFGAAETLARRQNMLRAQQASQRSITDQNIDPALADEAAGRAASTSIDSSEASADALLWEEDHIDGPVLPHAFYGHASSTAGTITGAAQTSAGMSLNARMRQIQRNLQPDGAVPQVRAARYSSGLRPPTRHALLHPAVLPEPATRLTQSQRRAQLRGSAPTQQAQRQGSLTTWMRNAASQGDADATEPPASTAEHVPGEAPWSDREHAAASIRGSSTGLQSSQAASVSAAPGPRLSANPFVRVPLLPAQQQVPARDLYASLGGSTAVQNAPTAEGAATSVDASVAEQLAAQIDQAIASIDQAATLLHSPEPARVLRAHWAGDLQDANDLQAPIPADTPVLFDDHILDLEADLDMISDTDDDDDAVSVISIVDLTKALQSMNMQPDIPGPEPEPEPHADDMLQSFEDQASTATSFGLEEESAPRVDSSSEPVQASGDHMHAVSAAPSQADSPVSPWRYALGAPVSPPASSVSSPAAQQPASGTSATSPDPRRAAVPAHNQAPYAADASSISGGGGSDGTERQSAVPARTTTPPAAAPVRSSLRLQPRRNPGRVVAGLRR